MVFQSSNALISHEFFWYLEIFSRFCVVYPTDRDNTFWLVLLEVKFNCMEGWGLLFIVTAFFFAWTFIIYSYKETLSNFIQSSAIQSLRHYITKTAKRAPTNSLSPHLSFSFEMLVSKTTTPFDFLLYIWLQIQELLKDLGGEFMQVVHFPSCPITFR